MCNINVLEQSSKLRLPSCFVVVTDDEMEYFDGAGVACGLLASAFSILNQYGL